MQFYKKSNIIRILRADAIPTLMVDVDIETKQILTTFDGTRPFDAAVIQSFINILTQSTTGFTSFTDKSLQSEALHLANLSTD